MKASAMREHEEKGLKAGGGKSLFFSKKEERKNKVYS